jgi:hypothetical protein
MYRKFKAPFFWPEQYRQQSAPPSVLAPPLFGEKHAVDANDRDTVEVDVRLLGLIPTLGNKRISGTVR